MRFAEELAFHTPVLERFAQRALGHAQDVEDLIQETLAAAVAHERGFQGRSSVRTWLVGILSHKIIDHLRRRPHPALQSELSEEELVAAPSTTPEHALDQKRAVAVIERVLPTLPEQERLAVLMIDIREMERARVCHSLGVTATHLRVLLHRGRTRLRSALAGAHLSSGW